jgi:hypothetical protein
MNGKVAELTLSNELTSLHKTQQKSEATGSHSMCVFKYLLPKTPRWELL